MRFQHDDLDSQKPKLEIILPVICQIVLNSPASFFQAKVILVAGLVCAKQYLP